MSLKIFDAGWLKKLLDAHLSETASKAHPLEINTQTGTSYTLELDDNGKLIDCDNSDTITLTVPDDSSEDFLIGTQILIRQKGAGQVQIEGATGVTLQSAGSVTSTIEQYSVAGIIKISTDTWALFGDLEEVA